MKDTVYFLAVYGLSLALTVLSIGTYYRELGEKIGGEIKTLVYCPACTGFWIALIFAFLWHSPAGPSILDRLASALAGSGLTWIIHVTMVKLGQNDL